MSDTFFMWFYLVYFFLAFLLILWAGIEKNKNERITQKIIDEADTYLPKQSGILYNSITVTGTSWFDFPTLTEPEIPASLIEGDVS